MKHKVFLTLVFALLIFAGHAQSDSTKHRFYGGVQIGGQNLFSLFHEFEFLSKPKIKLHSNLTVGFNTMGKNQLGVKERAIYGIQPGVLCLIGAKTLVFEVGILPAIYSYKVAFMNLNGWAGLRLSIETSDRIIISLGYTPRLFTKYTDPDDKYFNAPIGLKLGVNF